MSLSPGQVQVVIALERTGASLSLIGIVLILVTYWLFKRLRTIPNLFIVFASIANIGASIACVIGYDGIIAGEDSALCQAQAFMLDMCGLAFHLLARNYAYRSSGSCRQTRGGRWPWP